MFTEDKEAIDAVREILAGHTLAYADLDRIGLRAIGLKQWDGPRNFMRDESTVHRLEWLFYVDAFRAGSVEMESLNTDLRREMATDFLIYPREIKVDVTTVYKPKRFLSSKPSKPLQIVHQHAYGEDSCWKVPKMTQIHSTQEVLPLYAEQFKKLEELMKISDV
ncbi:MAG: hypothetical protein ABII01_05145 [Candidatus Woesearchaeota archaeon]